MSLSLGPAVTHCLSAAVRSLTVGIQLVAPNIDQNRLELQSTLQEIHRASSCILHRGCNIRREN